LKQEIIITGKTVELALKEAAEKLGISEDKLTYEVVDNEKPGFLGIGSAPAKVKITYTRDGDAVAKEFIEKLMRDMEIDAETELVVLKKSDRMINIKGDAAGVLIGHHGETLDALQYLVNLAANKREEDESRDYVHITVDIENYRAKREATLRSLARRMAERVKKYKKSVMLEPMPPNERRIIHSEIQLIDGVSTNSIGVDNNRRVVIYLESEGFSIPTTRERKTEKQPPKRTEKVENKQHRQPNKRKSSAPVKPKTTSAYHDGDDEMTAEELSNLISTYATKERPQREQPAKFKSFDDYINSLLGNSDDDKHTETGKSRKGFDFGK
jgi:spoIIIJ-associated protein